MSYKKKSYLHIAEWKFSTHFVGSKVDIIFSDHDWYNILLRTNAHKKKDNLIKSMKNFKPTVDLLTLKILLSWISYLF